MSKYAPHPAAEAFPAMSDDEFERLKADIAKHGLREPITLYQNKVLDGLHRLRACEEVGVPVRVRDWDGVGTPEDFVISVNRHRRHLTIQQRKEIAAMLIKADPEKSNREIAKTAKVAPTTVGAVRKAAENSKKIEGVQNGHPPTNKPKPNENPITRISVPEGQTVESMIRAAVEIEATGRPTAEAARTAGIGRHAFAQGARIVALADNGQLSARDKETVLSAIHEMNAERRIGPAWMQVQEIALRMWGKNNKGRMNWEQLADKRQQRFDRAFGSFAEVCRCLADVEIPYLSEQKITETLEEIEEARRQVVNFARRIKESGT